MKLVLLILIHLLCIQPLYCVQTSVTPVASVNTQSPTRKSFWTTTKKRIVFGLSALAGLGALLFTHTTVKRGQQQKALFRAVDHNKVISVEQLLNAGINPNFEFREHSPLFIAAERGYEQIVNLLLQHGANPNYDYQYLSPEGFTPLVQAIGNNHASIVKLLIDAGADPNGSKNNFRPSATPLLYAINHHQKDILDILLSSKKLKINEKINGHTTLYWVKQSFDPHVSTNHELIQLLEKAGAQEE